MRAILCACAVFVAALATSNCRGQAPANDAFASALDLGSVPSAIAKSFNTGASRETGEPEHGCIQGSGSVWFRWTSPTSGPAIVTTDGSDFDTILAVYTGNAVGTLNGVASDDDAGVGNASAVRFQAASGTTYHIAVAGFSSSEGSFVRLNINQAPILVPDATLVAQQGDGTFRLIDVFNGSTNVVAASALPGNLYVTNSGGRFVITGMATNAATNDVTLVASSPFGTSTGVVRVAVLPEGFGEIGPRFLSQHGAEIFEYESFSRSVTTSPSRTNLIFLNLPPGLVGGASSFSGIPTNAGLYRSTVIAQTPVADLTNHFDILVRPGRRPQISSFSAPETITAGVLDSFFIFHRGATGAVATGLPGDYDPFGTSATTAGANGTTTNQETVPIQFTLLGPGGATTVQFPLVVSSNTSAFDSVLNPDIPPIGLVGSPLEVDLNAFSVTNVVTTGLPPGLAYNPIGHSITGTPTMVGTFDVTYVAEPGTNAYPAQYVIDAMAPFPPSVEGQTVFEIAVSNFFSRTFTVANPAELQMISFSGPPPGEFFFVRSGLDNESLVICGTPTVQGRYVTTLTVASAGGAVNIPLVLNVAGGALEPQIPEISSGAPQNLEVGQFFSRTFFVSTSITNATAIGVPTGLTNELFSSSLRISGTPTMVGSNFVVMQFANEAGTTELGLPFIVEPDFTGSPVCELPPTIVRDVGDEFSIFLDYSPQTAPTAVSITGLPLGVSNTVEFIQGIVTNVGTYPLEILASNSAGSSTTRVDLVIRPVAVFIESPVTAVGTVNDPFQYFIEANEAVSSYSASPLPPGLALGGSAIVGVPTMEGVTLSTIGVSRVGGSDMRSLEILIQPEITNGFIPPMGSTTAGSTSAGTTTAGGGTAGGNTAGGGTAGGTGVTAGGSTGQTTGSDLARLDWNIELKKPKEGRSVRFKSGKGIKPRPKGVVSETGLDKKTEIEVQMAIVPVATNATTAVTVVWSEAKAKPVNGKGRSKFTGPKRFGSDLDLESGEEFAVLVRASTNFGLATSDTNRTVFEVK